MALTVANQAKIYQAIDRAGLAASTKTKYKKAISNAVKAGVDLTDPEELIEYAQGLGQSSKSFLKAGLRLWTQEIELQIKAGAVPDNVDAVQATIYRFEALNDAIKVKTSNGTKTHFWLTQSEVKQLMTTTGAGLKGQRDRVILGLLVGAGLRRTELSELTFDCVKLQGKRYVLDVVGKGDKGRVIPISEKLAGIIEYWKEIVGSGLIARSINKGGKLGLKISPIGIFDIVRGAGKAIDKPELAPHDLRRTYAQIGYEAGVPITQISKLLGHSSVATTQKYLNLDLDLTVTVSDFIPL